MINIRTINKLTNNDGITLKNGKLISYKTGYQVATEGVEVVTAREAINAVKAYNGNCGVWYYEGVYYVDKSHRVSTKRDAVKLGIKCKQISILKWADMSLIYCEAWKSLAVSRLSRATHQAKPHWKFAKIFLLNLLTDRQKSSIIEIETI